MYEYEMLSFLAGQYKPVDLTRALVAGTKVSKEAQLATRVLKCQVREWVRNESSEKEVFELLQIHQGEGDPFQRPLFFVWVNFVKLKYEKSLEEAEMKMFIFLEDYCKGDDLAKGAKIERMKAVAETLQKALNEGSPKVLKRHDNDVSEPPLQKRQKIDLELPTLKRQHSFDLNDPLPETESNLDLPPRED
ncbi:unnamed protein product [Peronospora farinosa]|uniref:Uncharacterized protein n=2 Tax=Peronospora farinosa TaxID=134698 RepID=A0AAV0STS0_9STRA|nr:unnamed protein product [Peronospora farinosa]